MTSRAELRKNLRQQRRTLSKEQQHHHARQLANHLAHSPLFRPTQHIACYLANDGEIDLSPLMQRAWKMGKHCYLPILGEGKEKRMWFAPYESDTPLKANRYGIPEPVCHASDWLEPHQLDLVLMPLVGFDNQGNRLGMGGGFYDRSFAFLNQPHSIKKPRLVGIAHELQRVAALPFESWDVPMNAIVTEAGLQRIKPKA